MKTNLTSKDFILLLGILVAAFIAIATILYKDNLFTSRPSITDKTVANHTMAIIEKGVKLLSDKF